jgi:predicted nucleic-acid-binding Zn-ribbon protein
MLTELFAMRCLKCGNEEPEIHGAIDFVAEGERYQMVVFIECPQCGEVEFIVKEMKAKTPETG